MISIIVAISLLFISTPSFATEQIKRTQFLLNQLGYNVGSIDGIYGSKTNKALKKYYKNKNEKFDGTLDSDIVLKWLILRHISKNCKYGGGDRIRTYVGLPRRSYSPLHLTALPPLP